MLDRLRARQLRILAFTFEAGVPSANNQTERDLRPAKVKQKVSGGFRTQAGAPVYARLQGALPIVAPFIIIQTMNPSILPAIHC